MAELKFIKSVSSGKQPACCSPINRDLWPKWIIGTIMTNAGQIPIISTDITRSDVLEHVRCRISSFRDRYIVPPGLYAVGTPDRDSDIMVSANYKLSFDKLRESLKGLNAWVLVLDTKGINVWCAAGKGTFGTDELVQRIAATMLDKIVDHRRIIVPQLGAPGISAHYVKKASGFHVCYGPVRACDIKEYIAAGFKATRQMRTVKFKMMDRLVLTPMEINPAMKKYYPWFALIILLVTGLQPEGIIFMDAVSGGLPFLLLGLVTVVTGALITPVLLPFIPFRSFAAKGWVTGILSTAMFLSITEAYWRPEPILSVMIFIFFPLASSYIALQFTGSTTFTGMSGVKKELKFYVPIYIAATVLSVVLLIMYKLKRWGIV